MARDPDRCTFEEAGRRCTGVAYHDASMNATPHTFTDDDDESESDDESDDDEDSDLDLDDDEDLDDDDDLGDGLSAA